MDSKRLSQILLVFALLFAQHASTLHALEHISGSYAHQTDLVCDEFTSNCSGAETETESTLCLIYHLHGDYSAYSLSAIPLHEQRKLIQSAVKFKQAAALLSRIYHKPIRGPPLLS